jgi:Fic family protein
MAHLEEHRWEGNLGARTRYERRSCTYRAYVPDPLIGREVLLPGELIADLADAERAVAALQDRDKGLASVESIARLLLRAESVGSSYIEGLQIDARRLAKEAFAEQVGLGISDDTARAVLSNIAAMSDALKLAETSGAISVEDLCRLHLTLMAGTREAHLGGVIRTEQNWVGGVNPCAAEFVPPPPEYVRDLLEDLCTYVSSQDHSPLVQAALAHAQFETIHPFADGNGRVGRALIHLVLRRRGLAPHFVPPVSLILATNSAAYIDGLVAYRHEGPSDSLDASKAAAQWIGRFTGELLRACEHAAGFSNTLDELQRKWRGQVGRIRAKSAVDVLLSALPGIPVLTVETAAMTIDRSTARTNDAVAVLVNAQVLTQGTLGRRNRVFEASGLLEAITSLEGQLRSTVDSASPGHTPEIR